MSDTVLRHAGCLRHLGSRPSVHYFRILAVK
jgi:hypothetical protein